MRDHQPSKEQVRVLCAELGEDDGQAPDPSRRRRPRTRRGHRSSPSVRSSDRDRKAWQLCRQVAETLDEVLAECGDGVLQGLRVASVEPFPDTSRLLVTVTPADGETSDAIRPEAVLYHLHHATGHLRWEVATAVCRRHAPLLVYHLADPRAAEVD
jgi:ribosome-binding factor A